MVDADGRGRAPEPEPGPERDALLERAAASLRAGGLHGPETRLLVLGVVLLVASLAFVVAGWYGASGTLDVGEQVPYLVSGGLGGVALACIGAALYVRAALARTLRYWLLRALHEQRSETERVVAALERVEAALREPSRVVD